LLVLTREFFVNNEIYMAFLLNYPAQGVSGKMNNLPKHHARGPQRRGAQCSCIGCIGLRPALLFNFHIKILVYCFCRQIRLNVLLTYQTKTRKHISSFAFCVPRYKRMWQIFMGVLFLCGNAIGSVVYFHWSFYFFHGMGDGTI